MKSLPKWPEMRTTGEKITPKQARNIIMKTDRSFSYLNCNDKEWVKTVAEILGLKFAGKYPNINWDDLDRIRDEFGHLRLGYISNDRIMTSYIGGPHGWVDWDGNIGEAGHNIGKWPSGEEVLNDWSKIAAQFPFLNMRCQLFDKEGCEDNTIPLIEYVINRGVVEVVEPTEAIQTGFRDAEAEIDRLFTPNAERGVDVKTLKLAVEELRPERGKKE